MNNLPPCEKDIFQYGEPVALLDGKSELVERWVASVAETAQSRVDWHYSGGVAQVLHLGDETSCLRTLKAISALSKKVEGVTILRVLDQSSSGLYRSGVTGAPEGTTACFLDIDGNPVYI